MLLVLPWLGFHLLPWSRELTVNLAKCEFMKVALRHFGCIVGRGQVQPVDAKDQAVKKFPVPTTKKDLRHFFGLVGYYRSFCRDFSIVVCTPNRFAQGKCKVFLVSGMPESV